MSENTSLTETFGLPPMAQNTPATVQSNVPAEIDTKLNKLMVDADEIETAKRLLKKSLIRSELDIDAGRVVLQNMLGSAMKHMEALEAIADSTQHPRAYEVLSANMKLIADIQDQIIKMNDQQIKITKAAVKLEKTEPTKVTNVTNNVVMTSTAMQNMIREQMLRIKQVEDGSDSTVQG